MTDNKLNNIGNSVITDYLRVQVDALISTLSKSEYTLYRNTLSIGVQKVLDKQETKLNIEEFRVYKELIQLSLARKDGIDS